MSCAALRCVALCPPVTNGTIVGTESVAVATTPPLVVPIAKMLLIVANQERTATPRPRLLDRDLPLTSTRGTLIMVGLTAEKGE